MISSMTKCFSLKIGLIIFFFSISHVYGNDDAPLITTPKTLPEGIVGKQYKKKVEATGEGLSWKWEIIGPSPKGLDINQSGEIVGIPENTGEFKNISITVSDKKGLSYNKVFDLIIRLVISSNELPDGKVKAPYEHQLMPVLKGKLHWNKVGGELPEGIEEVSDDGKISGTPTKAGKSYFDIELSDGTTKVQKRFSINIKGEEEDEDKLKTDRDSWVVEVMAGADFSMEQKGGNKNFSSAKPNVGIKIDKRWYGYSAMNIRMNLSYKLTSILVEDTPPEDDDPPAELTQEKSLAAAGGLCICFHLVNGHITEIGILIKGGIQTSETQEEAIPNTFVGGRVLNTHKLFNGAYFDIGYGYSRNFEEGTRRFKVEGFLPFLDTSNSTYFVSSSFDLGSGKDGVMYTIGIISPISSITNEIRGIVDKFIVPELKKSQGE